MPTMPTVLGVNLPWLGGAYGHDLAPNENHPDWLDAFDTRIAMRAISQARSLGFGAIRVWLCERAEGIVTSGGLVTGLHPALLEHAKLVEALAQRASLRVYWTLLDANAWKRDGDASTHSIVTDPAQTARFAEHVAAPIARALDRDTCVALEVLNEPEVMAPECATTPDEPTVSWDTLATALRTVGDAIRAAAPGTLVTAGSLHVFAPRLWRCGAALDAMDIHMYHATGGLPPRDQLAREAGDERIATGRVPLIAGECGLPDEARDGDPVLLSNYVHNAVEYGYAAAFVWKLEGDLVDRDPPRDLTPAGHEVKRALQSPGRRVRP